MHYLSLFSYFLYYQTVFPIDFTQSFCMPGENNTAKINIWYLTTYGNILFILSHKYEMDFKKTDVFFFKLID